MKYLMKITSKKINQNIISFYYRIPDFSNKAAREREKSNAFNFIKKLNIIDLHHIITKDPCSLNNFLKCDAELVIYFGFFERIWIFLIAFCRNKKFG